MSRIKKTPTSSNSKATTTTTTTTDKNFGSALVRNGVVFSLTVPPKDYDEIIKALAKDREVPASASQDWQYTQQASVHMPLSELTLESVIVEAMLLQHARPTFYGRFREEQWTEVENEITAGISDPKPNVTEAYTWMVYPPGTKAEFDELAPNQWGYAMPTFAMETKGASDPLQTVKRAAYDGAVMTHAALAVEQQMGKDDTSLYSKIKAITVTLDSKDICVYANHAVKDESSGKIFYHHHCVSVIRYLESEEDWKKAYVVLHNAQAIALALADARIEDIKKYFKQKERLVTELKAENDKLQAIARAKTKEVMPSPPAKRTC